MTCETIDELIAALQECRKDFDGGARVRIAYQAQWPLRGVVAGVSWWPPTEADMETAQDEPPTAWIAVNVVPHDEDPYAPKWAWGETEASS